MKFANTIAALKTFKGSITCIRCEKPCRDLQFAGFTCKHAFCWDCITLYTNESIVRKRSRMFSHCPECHLQLNLNKISGAGVLNSCSEILAELEVLLSQYENSTNKEEHLLPETQAILEQIDLAGCKPRTIDEFLCTQQELFGLELENKIEDRQSPEFDIFGQIPTNSPLDEVTERFSSVQNSSPLKEPGRPKRKRESRDLDEQPPIKTFRGSDFLFMSQLPCKGNNDGITPSVNRKESMSKPKFYEHLAGKAEPLLIPEEEPIKLDDDPFSKNILLPRRASTSSSRSRRTETKPPTPKSERRSMAAKSSPHRLMSVRRGEFVLINAIRTNRTSQVIKAIESGADVNECDSRGCTPLFVAVEQSNFEAARQLIAAGASINAFCGKACNTALHEAVRLRAYSLVELLIAKGASSKCHNSWQQTPADLAQDDERLAAMFADCDSQQRAIQLFVLPVRPQVFHVKTMDDFSLSRSERIQLPKEIQKENIFTVFKAMMRQCYIVNVNWIYECIRQKLHVAERLFEIRSMRILSDGAIVDGSVEKWRRCAERRKPGLFVGCKFHFLRPRYNVLDRSQLVELVREGGGEVSVREPIIDSDDPPPYHNPKLNPNFVVYRIDQSVAEKYRDLSRFSLVCEQWLLEAIVDFSLAAIY